MYSVGQTVLYGSNGVCKVEDITVKHIGSNDMEYYVLKPICSKSSTLFVPTGNEALVAKIRSVLTADEIHEILDSLPDCDEWIDNKLQRSELFRRVISGGNCLELIRLIRLIHFHADELAKNGKHLHISDDRFLKEAEKMVGDEVALVLQIDRETAIKLILK